EVGQLATTFNAMLSQLQDAYQQVARSLELQRNFVADVSHELRTPLTTIRGNLALLSRQPPIPQEEQADIMSDMVDESERLIRLVNDLLTLARADAGRHLKSESVEVEALIQDVCRQAKQIAPERTVLHATPPGATVLADPDALKQVLLVLVDNALKHTPGNVTIATRVQDHLVAIDVRDAGPGIDAQTCAHLFERFYRGSSHPVPGFGLGLSIAKALVEAQHGTIGVRSQVETGSVFTISLPRA
ncbi:MAG: HAMP domain-containing histidine kinase, partial [Anaerolineae bacterium]|nr:HAMP domain-containing histidine kinase [Anaerolineae bacterium]